MTGKGYTLDLAKYDAVPMRKGPPVEVGVCNCGGMITREFKGRLKAPMKIGAPLLDGIGVFAVWNLTCTKGGDVCVQEE